MSRSSRATKARASMAAALSVAAIAGAVSVASPAFAARVTCNINPVTGIKLTKTCPAIPSNRPGNWIKFDVKQVARSTEWWVTDLDTGVVVGHGTGSARDRTINGLYGNRYQLKVYGYGTNAAAWNS